MPELATVSARPLIGRLACCGSVVKCGQQSPSQHVQVTLAGLRVSPHNKGILAGREVPSWRNVRQRIDRAKQPRNLLRR
jgi:hypothetical protein